MKNKTIAAWLAFIGGSIGLHRFYLYGWGDLLGWLLPIPTVLGLYGVYRLKAFGVDDMGSWVLLPVFGFMIAGGALTGIVYGLKTPEQWNAKFNPRANPESPAGQTNWFTIGAVVLSMFIGGIALIGGIAMSMQHYFEYQIVEGRKISQ